MRSKEDLDLEIPAAIRQNEDKPGTGLYGYEVVGIFSEWGDPSPAERRATEQSLVRLVKRGVLVEDRETDPNGLAIYRVA
jgi:hypothetical protein